MNFILREGSGGSYIGDPWPHPPSCVCVWGSVPNGNHNRAAESGSALTHPGPSLGVSHPQCLAACEPTGRGEALGVQRLGGDCLTHRLRLEEIPTVQTDTSQGLLSGEHWPLCQRCETQPVTRISRAFLGTPWDVGLGTLITLGSLCTHLTPGLLTCTHTPDTLSHHPDFH